MRRETILLPLLVATASCSSSNDAAAGDATNDAVLADDTSATTGDASTGDDTSPPTDDTSLGNDAPPNDARIGDTGLGLPDGARCAVANDPCYKAYVAALAGESNCFHHTDTCSASKGSNASGCGTSTDNGQTCKWSDGATMVTSFDTTTGAIDILAKNGAGATCWEQQITSAASSSTVTYLIGTQRFVVTATKSSGRNVTTINCPGGSKVTFDELDVAACPATTGGACCSTVSPAKCP